MTIFSRKGFHSDSLVRVSLAVAAAAILATSAHAQSSASIDGQLNYSFVLDPNSSTLGSFLTVEDLGNTTYNIINGMSGAYGASTGTGTYSNTVDPSTYYDNTNWVGYGHTTSTAGEASPTGTASASVGYQQNIRLTNSSSTNSISLDLSFEGQPVGSASITGASSNSNFASVKGYIGVYDYDLTTAKGIANPLLLTTGNSDTGVTTSSSSEWTYVNPNDYLGSYVLTLAPNEVHFLEFYTSGQALTGSSVPTPTALAPMLVGLVGLAVRRRRQAR